MKRVFWTLFMICISFGNLWANAENSPVAVQTNPAPHLIQPDRDLVETTFSMPPNTEYEIIIRTPPTPWWVSTDFPIVENTQLYHFRGLTPSGEVRFETIYPIRGEYSIEVVANGKTHRLALNVKEAPSEIMSMVVFLGVLFLIGIAGGQIFLRSFQAKSAVAALAGVGLFSLLFIKNPVYAHNQDQKQAGLVHWEQIQERYSIEVHFDSAQAIVGESVEFEIQIKKEGDLLQEPIRVEIETFHMEDDTVMFKGAFTSKNGLMKQTLHFFDGAETKTTFTVKSIPNLELSTGGVVDVEGVAPPLDTKLKTMALLTLVVLGGMVVGFFLIPGRKMIGEAI